MRVGGRQSNATYQFTLQADDAQTLYEWTPRLTEAMQRIDVLDRRQLRPAARRPGERSRRSIAPTVARLGLTMSAIDNTLYDAFGQRQVSTIYSALNQYHVVMEVGAALLAGPADAERHVYVSIRRARNAIGRHAKHQATPAPRRRQRRGDDRDQRATGRNTRRTARSPMPRDVANAATRPARRRGDGDRRRFAAMPATSPPAAPRPALRSPAQGDDDSARRLRHFGPGYDAARGQSPGTRSSPRPFRSI